MCHWCMCVLSMKAHIGKSKIIVGDDDDNNDDDHEGDRYATICGKMKENSYNGVERRRRRRLRKYRLYSHYKYKQCVWPSICAFSLEQRVSWHRGLVFTIFADTLYKTVIAITSQYSLVVRSPKLFCFNLLDTVNNDEEAIWNININK